MEFKAIVDTKARERLRLRGDRRPREWRSRLRRAPDRCANRRNHRPPDRERRFCRQGGRHAAVAAPGGRRRRASAVDRPRAAGELRPQALPQGRAIERTGDTEDRREGCDGVPCPARCTGHGRSFPRAFDRGDLQRRRLSDSRFEERRQAQAGQARRGERGRGKRARLEIGRFGSRDRRRRRRGVCPGAGPREPAPERLHAHLPGRTCDAAGQGLAAHQDQGAG